MYNYVRVLSAVQSNTNWVDEFSCGQQENYFGATERWWSLKNKQTHQLIDNFKQNVNMTDFLPASV